ncbi:histidine phosphatase family protein [Bacillus sp. AGMB 02131]|uniref:Histidine phosphatase family protein n=1 Tax=Peribacillus faecalis TaxID=2772559 RepID=A0A927HDA7_9BACI|nr:histidine phosphatase family protein [Peribacillus faecalis]MBD3109253.1 histidine phosphatase family protein [Peribacillus faecalis]
MANYCCLYKGSDLVGEKIYLVRHCEAEGQSSEAPLTSNGLRQADQICEFFTNVSIEKIICSPFLRAIQTIEPLSRKRNIEIGKDDRLAERVLSSVNLPDWLEKLKATYEDMNLSFEGGESSREASERIVKVIEDVIGNEAEHTIIVSHGNILSLLIKHFDHSFGFEQWRSMSNPDVYLLTRSEEKHHIERLWK